MGLSSKNKITRHDLANGVAGLIFSSQLSKSLKQYSDLLKEIGEDYNISEKQKRELLAFDMFAATFAIQKTLDDPSERQYLLDCFHENIYNRVCETEESLTELVKFIQKRCQSYDEILSSEEKNIIFNLGKRFTGYFLNHGVEGKEIVLVVASGRIFELTVKTIKDFLEEVLAKFEIN